MLKPIYFAVVRVWERCARRRRDWPAGLLWLAMVAHPGVGVQAASGEFVDESAAVLLNGSEQLLERAYTAMEEGRMADALRMWESAAAQGSVTALLNLGQVYRLGKGVVPDDEAAVRWYVLAAQQGSEIAQHNLLLMREEGRASEADLAAVFAPLNEPAAEAGISVAAGATSAPPQMPAPPPDEADTPETLSLESRREDARLVSDADIRSASDAIATAQRPNAENNAISDVQEDPLAVAPIPAAKDRVIQQPRFPAEERRPEANSRVAEAAEGTETAAAQATPVTDVLWSTRGRRWLLELPDDALLLQVIALSNAQRLEALMVDYFADGRMPTAHGVEVGGRQGPLYVLVLGPFADVDAANRAAERLPEVLQGSAPWALPARLLKAKLRPSPAP